MKSSGRSIRRHVLLCYRRQFASECKGVSDAQIHDLLVSQEEKGAIHTGLKRWRLRRSRRLAMDLPPHERWDCPNQCGRYFRSTSSRSIAKHKLSCRSAERGEQSTRVQSSDATAIVSPGLHSSFASVVSPSTTSSSSSSFSSFSTFSSSSSAAPPRYIGASSSVADRPLSSSQPLVASGHPSESQPVAVKLTEPLTPLAAAAASSVGVIRPISRLHASLSIAPPAASSAFLTVSTTDKQILPHRIKPMVSTSGDGLPSLLQPSPSAFRPLYPSSTTAAATSYTSPSLPSAFFNLSPLHALASVGQGYVLCSFPAQQVQVPVIGWPY